MDWPAYSPDLNLWAIIKERLRKQTVSSENFEEKILEIPNNSDQEFVAKLYESMESWIEKLSLVKGAPIGH